MADATRCPCGEDHPCWEPMGSVRSLAECFCVLPQAHDGTCKCGHTLRREALAAGAQSAREATS